MGIQALELNMAWHFSGLVYREWVRHGSLPLAVERYQPQLRWWERLLVGGGKVLLLADMTRWAEELIDIPEESLEAIARKAEWVEKKRERQYGYRQMVGYDVAPIVRYSVRKHPPSLNREGRAMGSG